MLDANPATGYGWHFVDGEDVVTQVGASEFQQTADLMGAPGRQTLRFRAARAGTTHMRLAYQRPWESATQPAETFSVQVTAVGEPIADSAPEAEALADSSTAAPAHKSPDAVSDIPAAYNWCALGACTPIRDQGQCGSCWAFSTVGVLESRILMRDGISRDLAEQYLVSCNVDNWGCGGGWYAHDYHRNKKLAAEPDAGAVYEPDFAYVASNVACNAPHEHHEKIVSWRYVGTSYNVPSIAAIKQAILDYGLVAASVCVGAGFQRYTEGVFTQDEASSCLPYNTNHGVALVGWDDALGAWRLRNSWGTWWGEDGYMWIKYGVSNVGYAANYVVYGTTAVPPAAPANLMAAAASSAQINLNWTDQSADEDGFRIERSPNGLASWALIASLPPNATSYASTGLACNTPYYYRVRAYNAGGESLYSNLANATTAPCAYALCVPARALACGESHHWNNGGAGSTDVVDAYSCAGWAETGPEYGYTFAAAVTSAVTVTLGGLADGVDLDLFISGDDAGRCDSGACLVYADTSAKFRASPGRTYNLVVDGYNGGAADYAIAVQCAALAPSAPATLTAERDGAGVALTWADSSWNESGFHIERAPASGGVFQVVYTASANIVNHVDTDLPCGTAYQYRVRAFNAEGASEYSAVAHITTADCLACCDAYEPDDNRSSAQALTAGAPPQARNFHALGDQDWVSVTMQAGAAYTVTTDPGAGTGTDTFIELYDTDGATLLAQDDDSGPGAGSQIAWTAARDGAHFLRVYQFDGAGNCAGYGYQLSVAAGDGAPDLWHRVFVPVVRP